MALAVLFWLTMLVLPEVVESITNLANSLPEYYRNIVNVAQELSSKLSGDRELLRRNIGNHLCAADRMDAKWTDPYQYRSFGDRFGWADGCAGVLLNLVIGIIISIYLMAGKETFCAQAKRMLFSILPPEIRENDIEIGKDINRSFAKFFSGKLLILLL